MQLNMDPKALSHLAEAGFDPVYGARPLKCVIQQQLENLLAQSILNGQFKPGDTIEASWTNEEIEFKTQHENSNAPKDRSNKAQSNTG